MSITIQTIETITCKHCGSNTIVKFGTYKGNQRYWCKSCNRKFKFNTDAFHEKVPSEYITRAVSEYYSGMSINDIRNTLKAEHGYYPSQSVVWKWIDKYTDKATKYFNQYHPEVGKIWTSDETMVDIDGQHKVWIYNVIDEKTRFLLASRVALSRTTKNAELVMKEAEKKAGYNPEKVMTDFNKSYNDGIVQAFGSETEHVQTKPFTSDKENTEKIERYHGIYKDRSKVIRGFRDIETLIQYNNGFVTYYNYFKPHQSLDGKTPAEEANIKYNVHNWADLAKLPVTKESEIQNHKALKFETVVEKVNLDNAFKRIRGKNPRGLVHLTALERKTHRISQPVPRIIRRMPRITPKPVRLIAPHRAKQGGGITRRSDR
jgi:putative transposase